jgi:hypothetical protein
LLLTDEATINKNCDRILEYVSPSQVETFLLCPRRWYNDSVRGMREPLLPGSPAERGVHIAEEVEHYGKTGKVREDARFKAMVEAVLPHLSEPSETVSVEEWVEAETEPGLPKIRGRYDWFDCSQRQWVEGHPRAPLLPDVKSRSDFRYAKTPAELADDTQMNTYAVALARRDGYEHVTLRHAYTRTSGKPKGMAVNITVSRDEMEMRFLRTIESVREMTRWARERPRSADPLPPNPEACSKYRPHGCPHRALCGFDSPFQTSKETKMAETTNNGAPPSDLMKRLAQRTAELQAKNTGTAAPVAAPAPAPAPAREAITCSKCDEELTPDSVSKLKDGRIIHIGCPAVEAGANSQEETGPAVVSSDAPPRTNPPAAASAQAEEQKTRKPRAKKTPEGQQVIDAMAGGMDGSMRAAAEEQRRAQRSNIKGPDGYYTLGQLEDMAKEAPKEINPMIADLAQKMGAAQVVIDNATGQVKETAPARGVAAGPVVYVNCVPTKGAHKGAGVFFEEWLAPICEEVAKQKGVVDWRLIPYSAKGDLAAQIRKCMSACPPVVLVSKFSPAADVFLEAAIPWASQIIQGV